jgi:hypothetical protein
MSLKAVRLHTIFTEQTRLSLYEVQSHTAVSRFLQFRQPTCDRHTAQTYNTSIYSFGPRLDLKSPLHHSVAASLKNLLAFDNQIEGRSILLITCPE